MPIGSGYRLLFVFLLIAGCGKPPRKKMPDLSLGGDGFENPVWVVSSYYLCDSSVETDGFYQKALYIALPDPGYDSTAWSIVEASQLIARPLFNELLKQGDKEVILDLRNIGNPEKGEEISHLNLSIKNAGTENLFTVPVTLIWDKKNAQRAEGFLNALPLLTTVQCTRMQTSGIENSFENGGSMIDAQ